MNSQPISNSEKVFLNYERSPCQTLAFALHIIVGLGALAAAGVGLGCFGAHQGWWQAASLTQLTQTHSIIMMAVGGAGGTIYLTVSIFENRHRNLPIDLPRQQESDNPQPSQKNLNLPPKLFICGTRPPDLLEKSKHQGLEVDSMLETIDSMNTEADVQSIRIASQSFKEEVDNYEDFYAILDRHLFDGEYKIGARRILETCHEPNRLPEWLTGSVEKIMAATTKDQCQFLKEIKGNLFAIFAKRLLCDLDYENDERHELILAILTHPHFVPGAVIGIDTVERALELCHDELLMRVLAVQIMLYFTDLMLHDAGLKNRFELLKLTVGRAKPMHYAKLEVLVDQLLENCRENNNPLWAQTLPLILFCVKKLPAETDAQKQRHGLAKSLESSYFDNNDGFANALEKLEETLQKEG